MGGMKPQNGVALSAVAVTLLLLTTSLNAEFQSAHNDDPFVRSPPIVRKADTLSVASAQPGQYTAGTNGEFSAGQNISSDQRQQPCTAGVSTYASGRLHESALAKHATTGKHKDLWPLNNRDWWAFGIAAVAIFVAAGGGIGGGGILVPLYASVLDFPANYAVALSNFTIVGGAFANLFFNIGRRHSFKKKPLIDWDLILVMEPSTILGAVIGGYLNKTSPAWLASVLLAVLITAITWKLAFRALITWHRESEALAKPHLVTTDIEQPLLSHEQGNAEQHSQGISATALEPSRAIAPIRISSTKPAIDDHHEHHAHSPMAYSAVGSFTVGSRSTRPGRGTASALQPDASALNDGISQQTQQVLDGTGQHSLAADLTSLPHVTDNTQEDDLPESSQQPESPPITLHRLSQGAGFPAASNDLPHTHHVQSSGAEATLSGGQRPTTPEQKQLQQLLAKESKQLPPVKLGILLLLFAGVLATDLGKDYVPCNSLAYWGIVLSVIPFILLITLAVRSHLIRKYDKQMGAGYEWQEGDIQWSERNSIVYPAVSSLAGLVAGMFGVGGGIVKGPLMLEMGVLPDVAAATSATMILFTSASASVVYLSFGGIAVDYSLALLVLGFVVTLIGQGSTYWLMARLQRRSIVIIAMASLMLLATVTMYYESVVTFLDALHQHRLSERGHICTEK